MLEAVLTLSLVFGFVHPLALFWHRRWPFQDRDFLYDEDGRRIARPQALGEAEWMRQTPRSKAPRRLPPLMSPRNQELVQHRNRIMPIGGSSSLDPYWGAAGSDWRAVGTKVQLTWGEREVEEREREKEVTATYSGMCSNGGDSLIWTWSRRKLGIQL